MDNIDGTAPLVHTRGVLGHSLERAGRLVDGSEPKGAQWASQDALVHGTLGLNPEIPFGPDGKRVTQPRHGREPDAHWLPLRDCKDPEWRPRQTGQRFRMNKFSRTWRPSQ